MNEEIAVKNLRAVKEVFDEFGIKFWLDFGTLLGAVRDGKIIEWDEDIDLSMWSEDREKLLLALHDLKRGKFKAKVDGTAPLSPNNQTVQVTLFPYDSVIDIYLWQVKGDKATNLTAVSGGLIYKRARALIYNTYRVVRHYLYSDIGLTVVWGQDESRKARRKIVLNILEYFLPKFPGKLKTFLLNVLLRWTPDHGFLYFTPKRYFEKLNTLKFYGMTFSIPSDVEDYLKYHYGENWKIPQKKWDWTKDDRAQIHII